MSARRLLSALFVGALWSAAAWPFAEAAEVIELAPLPERPPAPMRRAVFISPAGEPFRANGAESLLVTWFLKADESADGLISLAEFTADHLRFFAIIDEDHDGAITGPEVTRYEHEIAPEILSQFDRNDPGAGAMRPLSGGRLPGARAPGGGRPGHGGASPGDSRQEDGFRQGAARFGLLKEAEPVRAADADLDFRVTQQEWRAAAASRLRKLDTNGDGGLHLVELQLQAPRGAEGRRKPRP